MSTTNSCDRLYFLEQHTKGHAKELVRSCQHKSITRICKSKSFIKGAVQSQTKGRLCLHGQSPPMANYSRGSEGSAGLQSLSERLL